MTDRRWMTRDELIVYLKLAAPVFPSLKLVWAVTEPGGYVDLICDTDMSGIYRFRLISADGTVEIDEARYWFQLAVRYGFGMEDWSHEQILAHYQALEELKMVPTDDP